MKQLLLLLFSLGCITLTAQNTGHLGKRLIVKTNGVNGRFMPFNCADLEYTLGRRTSILLSYQYFNYSLGIRGISIGTGRVKPGNNRGVQREKSILKNGTTTQNMLCIGLRHYFNRVIPAPYGWYVEFSAGYGSATFSNYTVSYAYKKVLSDYKLYPRPDSPLLHGKSTVLFFSVPSVGYQRIFKGLIVLDSKIALQGQYCDLPEEMLAALEHNYYVRSNAVNFSISKLSMGLAVYVKLGILIF